MIEMLAQATKITEPDTWMKIAERWGLPMVLVLGFIVWNLWEKVGLGRRLSGVEDFTKTTLVELVKGVTGVVQKNNDLISENNELIRHCKEKPGRRE